MEFTVHIPKLVLWIAGIIGGGAVLLLAVFGVVAMVSLSRFSLWR